uniref:Serine protease n=1 Tax=Sanxia water strider virus 12 TaxID=1923396 RepID=A0A1L3KEQ5_9VIRU|nr:hypothetical protein 2 [Sanxia water strider virus 12]
MVRITGCEAFKSTTCGILTPTSTLGVYVYSGTTKAGYSGAPYLVGDNSVAAMHLFGGDSGNLCVSARYIQMVIQQLIIPAKLKDKLKIYGPIIATTNSKFFGDTSVAESMRPRNIFVDAVLRGNAPVRELIPEAKGKNKKRRKRKMVQDDWYEEDMSEVKEIKARRSRIDPQNYEFQLGDHYYTVDNASFTRLKHVARKRDVTVYLGDVIVNAKKREAIVVCDDEDNFSDDESFLDESSQPDLSMWEEQSHYTEIQEVLREIRTLRTDFTSYRNSNHLNSTPLLPLIPNDLIQPQN